MTLRELREERGLTQQELAERLQVSLRSIVRWEQGEVPRPKMQRRIGEAFDVAWKSLTWKPLIGA